MSKIPLTPPPIPPLPIEDDINNIGWEKLKQNPTNKKYEKLLAEQIQQKADKELKRKKERRSDWWKTNAIGIVTLIIALATLIVTALK
ncbi:MAG: hypothetical protein HFH87_00675 [Lachnospiraceae bacterium]|nr:hypothetical protein [Lachnospiraceae bacterium]